MSEVDKSETVMPEQTVPSIVLPSWVKAATRCGFNLKPVLQQHGIELDLMHIEHSVVPLGTLDRVLESCIERSPEQHFPFVIGETFAFEYLPDLETFLTTSASLRDAARVLEWVPALINPLVVARIEEEDALARLVLEAPVDSALRARPWHAEMFFASILKFVRMLLGDDIRLGALTFRHAPPSYAWRYEEFFRLPVHFSQARDALVFDRELLDQPLEGDYPGLHQQAATLVEQRVARLTRREQLHVRLTRALHSDPRLLRGGVQEVARAFAMGPRTLQRRLRREHTSFAELLDSVRHQRALELLARSDMDLESISEALGFSDRRSFTRAFRRWTGMTPSRMRDEGLPVGKVDLS